MQVLDLFEDALLFHEELYCCEAGKYIDMLSDAKNVIYNDFFFYILPTDYELFKEIFKLIKGESFNE